MEKEEQYATQDGVIPPAGSMPPQADQPPPYTTAKVEDYTVSFLTRN